MEMMIEATKREELRTRIVAFEREQAKRPQVELRVVHYHSHGVVARELHIPKGTEITGATHKYENLNTLSMGEMIIITEDGPVHVKAPYTVVSPAGTKRAAITLTDCVWTTYFGTDEADPDKIVSEFTDKHEENALAFAGLTTLKGA